MAIPPLCLGVLICRNAVRDPDTHKYHLLGVSNFFAVPSLPEKTQLTLFLSLIEVNGSYHVEVRIVEVDDDSEAIFRTSGTLEGNDPLAVFQFAMTPFNVEFTRAGEYRLQLLIDGEIIAERKLAVRIRGGGDDGDREEVHPSELS